MQYIKNIIRTLAIRRNERWAAVVAVVLLAALWALMLNYVFAHYNAEYGYRRSAVFSGFDLTAWWVLSDWSTEFSLLRHPLLNILLFIPSMICLGSKSFAATHIVVFMQMAIWMVMAFYSFIFLFRTLRTYLRLKFYDSMLLTLLFFSLAYVMLATIVPDHMVFSMFTLTLTAMLTARNITEKRSFGRLTAVLLMFLSAGITLTNGIKPIIADIMTLRGKNGHRIGGSQFFRKTSIYLLPIALLGAAYFLQTEYIEKPAKRQQEEIKQAMMKRDPAYRQRLMSIRKNAKKIKNTQIANGKLFEFTDAETDRLTSVTANIFGEGLQLHDKHLMKDVNSHQGARPLFVEYSNYANDFVEVLLLIMLAAGIVFGHRSKLLHTILLWFLLDMVIHVAMTFAIKDAYIMTAHWALIFPIAMAFIFKVCDRTRLIARIACTMITLWLLTWNGYWLASYML